jgi:hypothetical protein
MNTPVNPELGVEALPQLGAAAPEEFSFLVRTPAGLWWRQTAAARLLAEREAPVEGPLQLRLVRLRPWRPNAHGEFLARFSRPRTRRARPRLLPQALGLGAAIGAIGALAYYAGGLPDPGAAVRAAPPPPAAPALPKLRLLGALLNGEEHAALIETPEGEARIVDVGGEVAGGVLVEVTREEAVLRFGTRNLRLQLPQAPPSEQPALPPTPLPEALVEPPPPPETALTPTPDGPLPPEPAAAPQDSN